MNVSFNRDHLTFKLIVDKENYEDDLMLGLRLEKLLEMNEFKILAGEWMKADGLFREAIMKVGMTDAESRITGKKCAAYNGFNEAVTFAEKIIKACKDFRKAEIQRVDDELRRVDKEDLAVPSYD